MKILLTSVRLAFPHLWKTKSFGDGSEGQPAYDAAFLIQADDPQVNAINAAIDQVAAEQWGAKAPAILAQLRAADKTCLHNGDLKADTDGYAGNWYINSRNTAKPLVLDRNKTILTEQDGRPYAGCYVNGIIDIYAQDNKWGKRINATLRGVQFVSDGDAFAGSPPASADEFEDLGVDGEALM